MCKHCIEVICSGCGKRYCDRGCNWRVDAGKYAKDLPSVPSVGEGRTLGAQQTDGAPAAGPEDETPAPRKKGKVDGPDRKSTRLNSCHIPLSRMPSSA